MQRVSAVLMAATKTVLWKLLLILILLAGAETVLFWRTYPGGFSYFLVESRLWTVFFLALAALCAVLCLQGCQFSGKPVYTLRRLPLPEEAVTLLWAAVHAACLVILWAFQLGLVWIFWRLFNRFGPASGQTLELFVNVYGNDFLHGLLPLADGSRHVRNVLWVLSLGFATAAFGYFQRRGRFRVELIFLLAVGIGFFRTGMGETAADIWISLLSLGMAALTVCSGWEGLHETP